MALLGLLSVRIENGVKTARSRSKYEQDPVYRDAHQAKLIKQWVTSQYCKTDLEILCPEPVSEHSCQAAFTPPMQFVLDMNSQQQDIHQRYTNNCSLAYLIRHTAWKDRESITDSDKDDTLIYFIAHLLEQIRTISLKYFRAPDQSILEYEQSRLIGGVLASVLDMFSTPTKTDSAGQTIATKATEFHITHHIWTRGEIINLIHEAVFWHTHHKRDGHTANGAALRVSRQMPSFVFKFLPLVKEQILDLETDTKLTSRLDKLYTRPMKELSLNADRPESDKCLWAHYEEESLISQDCMLALETAPLKIRDLDWEGSFLFVLVHIFTWFSAAYMLWMMSFFRQAKSCYSSTTPPVSSSQLLCGNSNTSSPVSSPQLLRKPLLQTNITPPVSSSRIMDVNHYSTKTNASSDSYCEQIRRAKKYCSAYLILSCIVGWISSRASETIQFIDFFDGICMALTGFLSLHFAAAKSLQSNQWKSRAFHYKKRASLPLDDDEFA